MTDKYCCKVTLTCPRRSFHGSCSKWYHYSPNQPGLESQLFSLSSFSLSSAVLCNLLPSSFPVLFLPATAQTPATYDHSNPEVSLPPGSLYSIHTTHCCQIDPLKTKLLIVTLLIQKSSVKPPPPTKSKVISRALKTIINWPTFYF